MRDFSYLRADTVEAARHASALPGAMLLAGGTTLVDLAKCGVAEPSTVIDISHIEGLSAIDVTADRAMIGALAKMSHVADHAGIKTCFPAVSEALWQAASAQLRNMATIGGNLMQRTRCPYFRDPANFPACNKRAPGSGCSAIGGVTRGHAVLGTSEACIATYPGDLAIALVAFDAEVHLGERRLKVEDFFLAPGATAEREHDIRPGEVITAIEIPGSAAARRSTYLKVRDRQSYEFAAASAAIGLELEGDGRTIRDIRVALGGVATKPWRARAVENELKGKTLTEATVRKASELAMEGAVDHGANHYKIELAPRVVARAILNLGETA
ncbi:xanthine dehydrogenase family protein subunit M [Mesorhizobium sp. M4A.F.Ca.ET.020.02.1.1]|uniref:FAD binding domain-containing protein n=2 Tax=Mesorhizobium TaxID=68287 RepID=UPI000FCBB747|nr:MULTISPECIES: xanthine dehydrogenase family protein subunit M [unclassified Mesorhizobium]RUX48007.1 xanthine dehydrogenase family protein subunit M [Mesorhizobium sp. M4A.F.Ca.ET.050.02.1.1]RVD43667.1 xanthine dehydrogenase family protein subunit M [Mesorhizobium sp. M4A.F.Ca.ET.020.02.1.1]RWC11622.1 MAG: xanthine dehydrogenase family protein subunit M [Mesorhizobium sp.]RWD24899.1 MAG: xanthine dehydrogenase family protein subunit M [Mesorhizobium sp.]RWD31219.1 MAG: xanthine dehydrogenas